MRTVPHTQKKMVWPYNATAAPMFITSNIGNRIKGRSDATAHGTGCAIHQATIHPKTPSAIRPAAGTPAYGNR